MNALTKRKLDRASLVVRQPHLSLGSLSRSELASLLGDRAHLQVDGNVEEGNPQ